jgi:signal peptidase II
VVIYILFKRYYVYYIALFVLILDFLTKLLIRHYSPNFILLPFLHIINISNTGAAFGILKGFRLLFIIIAVLVVAILSYYYKSIPEKTSYIISLGLILGGTLGNLIDRIFYGYVTDFIAFSFWPAFNIADASLCVGVMILFIVVIKYDFK